MPYPTYRTRLDCTTYNSSTTVPVLLCLAFSLRGRSAPSIEDKTRAALDAHSEKLLDSRFHTLYDEG